jgi:hypothetical protein
VASIGKYEISKFFSDTLPKNPKGLRRGESNSEPGGAILVNRLRRRVFVAGWISGMLTERYKKKRYQKEIMLTGVKFQSQTLLGLCLALSGHSILTAECPL